jgi:hypothetical protein
MLCCYLELKELALEVGYTLNGCLFLSDVTVGTVRAACVVTCLESMNLRALTSLSALSTALLVLCLALVQYSFTNEWKNVNANSFLFVFVFKECQLQGLR